MIRRSLFSLAALAVVASAAPRTAFAGSMVYQSCTAATVMTSFASYVGCAGSYSFYGGYGDGLAELGASDYLLADSQTEVGSSFLLTEPIDFGTRFVLEVESYEGIVGFYLFNGSNGGVSIPVQGLNLYFGGTGSASTTNLYVERFVEPELDPSPAVSTVPEPSTYALMSAGLLGLGFLSRRRRKA